VIGRGMLEAVTSERQPVSEDERALLDRARDGDRRAFDEIVRRHLEPVWRVAWRILRHRDDAEDVAQDVFLAAYKALPDFRGDSSLATWLHKIAVTRALNHRDRSAERLRRAGRSLQDGEDERFPGSAPDERLVDSQTASPLQVLEGKDLLRRLQHCLDRLPEPWRAVLALRENESLSYEEISRVLDLALGTVRSRLARARWALKRCIEEAA